MKARPDLERIVTDWLHDDATTTGSDRVLAGALVRVSSVGQERAPRLRRFFDMNTYAKLAIGVAAVAVVAVIGINLLPASDGGVGATAASPSPSPAASPSPSPRPSPAASPVADFPPLGPLAVGTYAAVVDGVPLSFSVPSTGWANVPGLGYSIGKGEYEKPDGSWVIFWPNRPENVYSDPCAHTPLSPAPSATAADLAAAIAAIPGTDVAAGPSIVTVGGRPAQHVAITIRDDLGCDPHDAYLWYDESSGGATGGWRWAAALGSTIHTWIIDVDGKLVWIDAETFKGAGPKVGQEVQQFIDSIKIE